VFTVTLTINPKPSINLVSDTICSGGSFTVIPLDGTNGTIPAGTTYSWPAPVISGSITGAAANAGPAANISGSLTNTSGIIQTATYTVTPVSGACTGTTFPVIIRVKPVPSVTADPVNRTVCEYSRAVFSVTASGGSDMVYQWFVNKNDGSGFVSINPADAAYIGATTATLTVSGASRSMNGYIYHASVSDCSVTDVSADATLTVNNNPEILTQPSDSVICLNNNASFTVTGSSVVSYKWQIYNTTGFTDLTDGANFAGSSTNTLNVINAPATLNNKIFRAVLTGSCGDPIYSNYAELKLFLPPAVTVSPADKSICDGGGPVTFSSTGSGAIDSLRWQVFTGGVWTDIHDNGVYSGTTSQTLTLGGIPLAYNGNRYRLAYKAKCATVYSNSALLTVNANPVVDFSAPGIINACGGVPVTLHGNPSGGSGSWSQHTWTGDVGPLNNYYAESPSFTTSLAGSYVLNYKVKDSKGCFASDDITIVVESPSADFQKSVQKGCTPLTVNFTKDMTGLAKFRWDFDDGSPRDSVNANPVHIFRNTNPASIEYFDVKLTVWTAGGCSASYTSSLMVYPEIDASFTASNDTVCSGGTLTFTSAPGASKYYWNFGDGNSGYSVNETNRNIFTNPTTAPVTRTVTLTTTSFYNCTDVQTMNIVVMPVPLPQFQAAPLIQTYNAAGNPVTFTNQTNAGTWTWGWKFGDGGVSTAQNPAHTYTNIGDFNVVLTVRNVSCTDSVKHTVTVRPQAPVAQFDSIPSGCSPLSITINNTSLYTNTPGTTYFWSFGDGSTSTAKNPTYTYFDAGTYRVELTVRGPGGVSTMSRIVNAYPSPIASLKLNPNYVYVNDEAVRFFNLSQGGERYIWNFGDGDTSMMKEPTHKYMEEGIFDITLWAYSANGCVDQYVLSPGVTVEAAGGLRFSTVFRPNLTGPVDMDHLPEGGPEADQFFYPPIREKVLDYKLQIFNRWGVLIFETHDINRPWNGYYKNELCQQGVYVWYVEGKYSNGSLFRKAGDITLLH
jgi:PKD repeat protein